MRLIRSAALLVLAACASEPQPYAYWQDYVTRAEATGLLRQERAPPDAPFDTRLLVENFRRIALAPEADPFRTGRVVDDVAMVRKWRRPIRYRLIADPAIRARHGPRLDRFALRLRRLTGHPIAPVAGGARANLFVVIASEARLTALEDPRAPGAGPLGPELRREMAELIPKWRALGGGGHASPCFGSIYASDIDDDPARGEIAQALVVIRAEMPPVMIDTCIEEELTQSFGATNDHPLVRPSVFNDDDEFAVLTEHDAQLLRLLYDPGIEPGMAAEAAMAVVQRIAPGLGAAP